jgi:pimeloyl-ACP methyl ester carboxylesterase
MSLYTTETIMLRSGRRIAVYQWEPADPTATIVLCHPAPGSGDFNPDPQQMAKRAVTLLSLDRPGYGDSEPLPVDQWATVAQAADDLAEVLQQRNLASVGVAGWSGGGRVALALAARHPHLVDRVAILSTPAPDEIIPWVAPEQRQAVEALRGLPAAEARAQLAAKIPWGNPPFEALLSFLARGPADDAALTLPGVSARLQRMLTAAFHQGTSGLASEILGYCLHPWGFEPSDVSAKTLCLYGSADPIAGAKHGSWWQKNLPQARLEMVPGAGHLLAIPMWYRVLSHLAPGSKRRKQP